MCRVQYRGCCAGGQLAEYKQGERRREAIRSRCKQGSQLFVIMERINCQRHRGAVLTLLQCRRSLRAEAKACGGGLTWMNKVGWGRKI